MTTYTNNNVPLLHRKEWQMMSVAPVATLAGSFVIAPASGNFNNAMYVTGLTSQFLYNHDEDGFMPLPSAGLAGIFGAGACGVFHPWSINYTANGGTTTSVTVAAATHNITGRAVGSNIEFISAGTASGFRAVVTSILNNAGAGTITLNFDTAMPTAILNTHTFRLTTGKYYVLSAGTVAAGFFKVFDLATVAWQASLVTTNLPASWGTDGKLITAFNFGEIFGSGTATAGAATTITNTAKTWTVNQWTNSEIRITGGTGKGQYRTIASNTADVITVSAAWTVTPDATSTYEITACSDYLYLMGNAAVTMYRYSITANTWTVMAPTVARAGAPAVGMSGNAIGITGDAIWADEANILNGRYIYSLRAGAGAIIDRFDIAGGTAGAGAWVQVNYIGAETYTTGSSAFPMGEFIYIRKDATNRFYKYSVVDNALRPFNTLLYTEGVAVAGNKIWVKNLGNDSNVKWLYSLGNTLTTLHRVMIY